MMLPHNTVATRWIRGSPWQLRLALRAPGWSPTAQRGSYIQLINPDKPGRVTVPVHAGETPDLGAICS